jgi:hypothetical protein
VNLLQLHPSVIDDWWSFVQSHAWPHAQPVLMIESAHDLVNGSPSSHLTTSLFLHCGGQSYDSHCAIRSPQCWSIPTNGYQWRQKVVSELLPTLWKLIRGAHILTSRLWSTSHRRVIFMATPGMMVDHGGNGMANGGSTRLGSFIRGSSDSENCSTAFIVPDREESSGSLSTTSRKNMRSPELRMGDPVYLPSLIA